MIIKYKGIEVEVSEHGFKIHKAKMNVMDLEGIRSLIDEIIINKKLGENSYEVKI